MPLRLLYPTFRVVSLGGRLLGRAPVSLLPTAVKLSSAEKLLKVAGMGPLKLELEMARLVRAVSLQGCRRGYFVLDTDPRADCFDSGAQEGRRRP